MASPRRPFVGRDREIEELSSGLDEAVAGRGGLFLVVGAAGMGKTRLCDEASRAAEGRGLRSIWGRCWETGGAPAYWPWIQLLRDLLRAADRDSLLAALGAEAAALAQLLPELTTAPAAADSDPAATRFRLFQAVVALLRAAGERAPLLLVLDDLHTADPSSLALLHFVARNLRGLRVLVLGAYRDEDARLSPELGPVLTDIAREGTYLPLPALVAPDIAALVNAAGGAASAALVEALERASEGNPLFLGELIRLLVQRGDLARGSDPGAMPIPDTIKEVIARRLARLAPATGALLEVASVIGRDFEGPQLTAVSGEPAVAVGAALGEAERGGLIAATTAPGWRFSHLLVREALYRALPDERRATIHAAVAERLEATTPDALAEIAHHRLAALPVGDRARAATAARRAAERAMAMLAFEDAAVLFEAARRCSSDARAVCELEMLAGLAHLRAGAGDRGRAACAAAAAEAQRLGDGILLARAALGYGAELMLAQSDRTLIDLLEAALAALPAGPSGLRAQCLARLAAARQPCATPAEPMQMARDAVAMARAVAPGDLEVMGAVLSHAGSALSDFAHPAERAPLNEELAQVAARSGDRVLAMRAQSRLCFDHFELGQLPRSLRAADAYEAIARELRQPRHQWPGRLMRAMVALATGDFAAADRQLAEAQELARGDRDRITEFIFVFHGLGRALQTERPTDLAVAEETLNRHITAQSASEIVDSLNISLAALIGWRGDEETARRHLAAVDRDSPFVTSDGVTIALAARAAGLLGDRALAAALYPRLAPYPGRMVTFGRTGMGALGSTETFLGILAALLDRPAQAQRHFEAALPLETHGGFPIAATHTRFWYARFLLARRATGDEAKAAALIDEARATAERLGLGLTLERLATLRAPAPRATPAPARSGSVAFTLAREGEYWTVTCDGAVARLKESRGLEMLAELIAHPGQEFHVLALMGSAGEELDGGDAGEVLDREAIDEYRARLRELDEELAEAESWSDPARVSRAREEREALARELSRGVGLGGRERRAGGAAERARTNVQRRVRGAIRKIAEAMPALGTYLERAVRTGTFCSYDPY